MPEDRNPPDADAEETELVIDGDALAEEELERSAEAEATGDTSREQDGELERLRADLAEYRELYLRKLAEFDNFRKRVERDAEELQRAAGENLVRDLVPVLDNFERALQHGDESDPGAFRQGVEMIARQLWDVLQRQGLDVNDPVGELFRPEIHEAVQRVEGSDAESGTVVSVFAKGYLFRGRLLRPAMVSVAVDDTARNAEPGDVEEDALGEEAEA